MFETLFVLLFITSIIYRQVSLVIDRSYSDIVLLLLSRTMFISIALFSYIIFRIFVARHYSSADITLMVWLFILLLVITSSVVECRYCIIITHGSPLDCGVEHYKICFIYLSLGWVSINIWLNVWTHHHNIIMRSKEKS